MLYPPLFGTQRFGPASNSAEVPFVAGSRRLLWQFLPRPRPTPRWYVPTTSSGRKGNPFCTLRAEVRMLAQSLRHHTPPETGGHFHCSSRDLGLREPASLLAQPCVTRHFGTRWFLPWSTGMTAKPPRLRNAAQACTACTQLDEQRTVCRQGEAFSGFYRPRSRPSPRWHVPTAKAVSYTHLTLPTNTVTCRSRWSPYH
mgnify:CR=1 FL=1